MFVHGVNVLMSDIVAHNSASNACVPYFLNILLDTTLGEDSETVAKHSCLKSSLSGVGIIYLMLYILTYLLIDKLNLKGFESGKYGSPPSIFYWARQAAVYVLSLTTMKLAVFLLFALFPGIFDIGEWLLSWTWTGKGDALQVILYVFQRNEVIQFLTSHSTMGIFPIMMNILQFWLIDSIVKASAAVALPPDSTRNSFGDLDREPLFEAPSDDEDESGNPPQHDIENPRPPSDTKSITIDKSQTGQSTPAENKSTGSGSSAITTDPRDATTVHSYPPSIASTSTTRSTSPPIGTSPKRIQKQFKRRPPPPALHLEAATHPAANIPAVPNVEKGVLDVEGQNKEWDESWDDSDDWANKVGEDEWTGRRIAEKKDILNTWVATAVHTGVS